MNALAHLVWYNLPPHLPAHLLPSPLSSLILRSACQWMPHGWPTRPPAIPLGPTVNASAAAPPPSVGLTAAAQSSPMSLLNRALYLFRAGAGVFFRPPTPPRPLPMCPSHSDGPASRCARACVPLAAVGQRSSSVCSESNRARIDIYADTVRHHPSSVALFTFAAIVPVLEPPPR